MDSVGDTGYMTLCIDHFQRDIDFTVSYDFEGELMNYHTSQDYHMH